MAFKSILHKRPGRGKVIPTVQGQPVQAPAKAGDRIRIGTFNLHNLFYRYMPLDLKSTTRDAPPPKLEDVIRHLQTAGVRRDQMPYRLLTDLERQNTAKVITATMPDVLVVIEVEELNVLRDFNLALLDNRYPRLITVEGNDPRSIEVGVLSRYEILEVKTHQFDLPSSGETPIFSRDCLEIVLDISAPAVHQGTARTTRTETTKELSIFANHFKSQIGGGADKRRLQAEQVRKILKNQFGSSLTEGDFIVAGDLNDDPDSDSLKLLISGSNFWSVLRDHPTYYYGAKQHHFDYLLLSSALRSKNPNPNVGAELRGISKSRTALPGPRFDGVGNDKSRTQASDHGLVWVDINV